MLLINSKIKNPKWKQQLDKQFQEIKESLDEHKEDWATARNDDMERNISSVVALQEAITSYRDEWREAMREEKRRTLATELTLFYQDHRDDKKIRKFEWDWVCEAYNQYVEAGGNGIIQAKYEEMKLWDRI